jgi:two-component system, OmpR family, KDP operon response regulator KdpE
VPRLVRGEVDADAVNVGRSAPTAGDWHIEHFRNRQDPCADGTQPWTRTLAVRPSGTPEARVGRGFEAKRKRANTVLVIDDESQIRRFIDVGLELHGYAIREAGSGAAGLKAVADVEPELIVLDLGLPDMSGVEVLRTVRSRSNVPIIVLSIQADEEQKVQLLKMGADDYVVKPFGIAELAARCEAALRRYRRQPDSDTVVRTGPLAVDLLSRIVTFKGEAITLTRKEYRLLEILASNLGLAVTHEQLIKELWGTSSPNKIYYLRMLVRRLRKELDADPKQPKLLISEFGVGYRLQPLDPDTGQKPKH